VTFQRRGRQRPSIQISAGRPSKLQKDAGSIHPINSQRGIYHAFASVSTEMRKTPGTEGEHLRPLTQRVWVKTLHRCTVAPVSGVQGTIRKCVELSSCKTWNSIENKIHAVPTSEFRCKAVRPAQRDRGREECSLAGLFGLQILEVC
jgi:hypothetical protein